MNIIKQYDDQKHENEVRFRLLITDACNLNCSYCLNDFMNKSQQFHFADLEKFNIVFYSYVRTCLKENIKPILTIAGGEPSLHPKLGKFVDSAYKIYLKLNIIGEINIVTNGSVFNLFNVSLDKNKINRINLHLPITKKDKTSLKILTNNFKNISCVQTVINENYDSNYLHELVELCDYYKIPLKFFSDFYDSKSDNVLSQIIEKLKNFNIHTRFTGKQTNRGILCDGCVKKCITLKAVWMDPFNKVYICPQSQNKIDVIDVFDNVMLNFFNLHKKKK